MAEQPTLVQRIVLWVLNFALFYAVAIHPAYQMAGFASDSTVHYTFLGTTLFMLAAYAVAAKVFAR